MAIVAPVIVVPGITASYLRDEYRLPPDTVWSVLKKHYERISLHPDNVRYEAIEPARLVPGQIYEVTYKELTEELRHNLREREDRPVPVFLFSYDWRHPLTHIETQLQDFISEVIARTLLLRHYQVKSYTSAPKVNLVAHSMGGLIATGYLEHYGKKARVGKVVTLAAPFRGSFEAVIKLATGTAALGTDAPESREREAARVTPAIYHLLPTCDGLDVDPGLPPDIFDPDVWQPGVLQTLQEYVRLHAVSRKNRPQQAQALFGALLETARKHRRRIEGFRLSSAGLGSNDWLCVVGVGATTRVRLKVEKTARGPEFRFRSQDRVDQWSSGKNAAERKLTGDGTVPFEGGCPAFLGLENIVCVSPEDFGYWELQDRLVSRIAGFHGILPNMDMLHRLIVRHFTGRPDNHGNTWGRSAPGVAQWQPPLNLTRRS